jgi:hypothetical protein
MSKATLAETHSSSEAQATHATAVTDESASLPVLLGCSIEHPLRSPVVPLPFKQVHYFIHPLGGEIPVLPEILEGLHLASQRLRSRAQAPVQSAPAIRQGLAPAGSAAPGTRLTWLLFPAWHSEPHEKP